MTAAAAPDRTLLERASAARRARQFGEAKRLLGELLTATPAHAQALNSLGLVALEEGDPVEATRQFERAAAADPNASPILMNLSLAHRERGDAAAEIAALNRALAIEILGDAGKTDLIKASCGLSFSQRSPRLLSDLPNADTNANREG